MSNNDAATDSTKLLFVNGLYQNSKSWNPIRKRLSQYPHITFDLPNQQQEKMNATLDKFEDYAGFINDIINKELAAGTRLVGIGLSVGANILRYLHHDGGVDFDGLVLLSPNPGGLATFYGQYVASLQAALKQGGIKSFVDLAAYVSFSAEFFESSPLLSTLIYNQFDALYRDHTDALGALITAAATDPTLATPPATFRCRTKVIIGNEDYLVPKRRIADYMGRCNENAELVTAAGGHSFIMEQPETASELVAAQILDTLSVQN